MPSTLVQYRIRIRNAADTADALEVTSVQGGTNPWIEGVPTGDGATLSPFTGRVIAGAYNVRVIDGITAGTSRLFTSILEDAGSRQQQGNRKTHLEFRDGRSGNAWISLTAGYLTKYVLANDVVWDLTISDPMRVEHEYTAFAPLNGESFASFLSRWPNRGCIFGGPITGGLANLAIKDLGGWEVRAVASRGAGTDYASQGATFLQFVAGYGPPQFKRTTRLRDHADLVNKITGSYNSSSYGRPPEFPELLQSFWPGIIFQVRPASSAWGTDAATIAPQIFVPEDAFGFAGAPSFNGKATHGLIETSRLTGLFVAGTDLYTKYGPAGSIAPNAPLRIRAFTALPSELSPIYWSGHPVDLAKNLGEHAGLSFDASTAASAKAAVGDQRLITIRIMDPKPLGSFAERTIYGPFGVGARSNAAAVLELFSTRIFSNTPPAVEITNDDVIEDTTRAFALDVATAVRKLTVSATRLVRTESLTGEERERTDGLAPQNVRLERINGDPGAIGQGEVAYEIEGMVHLLGGADDFEFAFDDVARQIFDRAGRGMIVTETTGIRGGVGDGLVLGQEVLVNVKQLPNHNKRLGDDVSVAARAMQVTRLTPILLGYELRLEDSGPNAQPFATVPTLAIAVSAVEPQRIAELTLTNAATLNAAGAGVRVVLATTPGGAPAASDYTPALYFDPGAIPIGAIRLPAVAAGRSVYAKALSVKDGSRPSNYSAAVTVTLTGLGAPNTLVATPNPGDGSKCLLTWVIGANATRAAHDVYVRLTTDPAGSEVRIIPLPAGSTRFLLEHLTPNVGYTAGVQARDESTGDLSALTTVAFATANVIAGLNAPLVPTAFAGSPDPDTGVPQRDGIYGLAVVASELPSFIEIDEALETGVGSGVYGAFATVDRVASVAGTWTKWQGIAPNDGKRRQLRTRHTRDGATPSTYAATVTVLPWSPLLLAAVPLPTLELSTTPGTPSYAIAFASNAVVESKTNAGAFAAAVSPVVVPRNSPGGADKVITFRATLAGQETQRSVSVPPIETAYDRCIVQVNAADGDEVDIIVTSLAGGQVRLVSYHNAAPTAGAVVGTLVASGSIWTFPRNAFQIGQGSATFEAVTPGFVTDQDVIVIPEVGRDTVALVCRAENIAGAPAGYIRVRVSADDPLNVGGNNIVVSVHSYDGVPAAPTVVSGSSPIADGGSIDYQIQRPAAGSRQGRVVFEVSMAGRVDDYDAIEVLPSEPLVPTLDIAVSEGTTETTFTFSSNGTVEKKIDSGAWGAAISPFAVPRNAANGPSKTVQIRATLNGQTAFTACSVLPQVPTPPAASISGVNAFVIDYFGDGVRVSWTFTGLQAGWYMKVERSVNGGGYAVASGNLTASPFDDTGHGLALEEFGSTPVTIDYVVKMYNASNVLQVTSSAYTLNTQTA